MSTQITMDEKDWNDLKHQITVANQETATVRVELEAERARPADVRLAQAHEYIDASKAVIDYAVGNLAPEFSRNWPLESMRALASCVGIVGAVTSRDEERALIWTQFCETIVEQDRRWARSEANKAVVDEAMSPVLADFEAARLALMNDLQAEKIARKDAEQRTSAPEAVVPWAFAFVLLIVVLTTIAATLLIS